MTNSNKMLINTSSILFIKFPIYFIYNPPTLVSQNNFIHTFCGLCEIQKSVHDSFTNVRRSSSSDKIHFEIEGTEFELNFIYKTETNKVPKDSNWIEPLMRKIYKNLNKEGNSKENQQNSLILYNLSLFKTFEYLENLIKNKNEKNILNQSFIYLKNWAKENNIYNNQEGFLDGNIISVMLIKVFLLYPGANLMELIERFFLKYSTWNWQFSLRINKKQNEEEKQLKSMTIYTPTYPELSITAKITKSTEKIILDAFIKGLEKTMNIRLLNKE